MKIAQIQTQTGQIIQGMIDKGLIQPDAHVTLRANTRSYVYVAWRAVGGDSVYGLSESEFFYFEGDNPKNGLDAARKWLADLPSADDKLKADAISLTAKAIEASRAAGLEPEFLNPLETMMKKLSENVITDQSNDPSE